MKIPGFRSSRQYWITILSAASVHVPACIPRERPVHRRKRRHLSQRQERHHQDAAREQVPDEQGRGSAALQGRPLPDNQPRPDRPCNRQHVDVPELIV
ncbi:hypothetical protein KL929_004189 [Ogataea haglerorum]|uniref:uncharacterized protein n=1 Tax=Ogataea haglerorum TaxID=1937702 RepID=UPI001C89FBC2|nr:uncharacterized protein KL911_004130 [Ogataea haglerorum]KAG7691646.1 hypothetical protein KL951_005338 [Ogataea haglerorum]KAG7693034.1 hypothetical protein KL915_004490 [Ogataea haglerorum]KAG7704360.1 hypothetical protein KL914_004347 [Ogataea haglerorum]KAG7704546.1 hypothetical protein KL950_004353 [Ogataea haglerorum]KAG7715834.1 hypothetical protein KL913_003647 [Ogataea haglerorum]